jgi:hypothetical protein
VKHETSRPGRKGWPLAVIVLVGLICGVVVGFFLLKGERPETSEPSAPPTEKPLPRMANLPPREETPPPQVDYAPDAPALEQARKALREGIDPAEAVAMAASLPESPERADAAFLLLEYAADSGHGEAAFLVACYYDPTDSSPSGSIRKNAQSAYEWYRAAVQNGQPEASDRLARLKASIREKAVQGSWESEQLLKNWE